MNADALPCHYVKYYGVQRCSGPVAQQIRGFYKNHHPKEMPPHAVDTVPVCAAHADWHEKRCRRCFIDYLPRPR